MKFKSYISISKLIARHLSDDLSAKENKEFDSWLTEDSSHKILFENIVNQQNWEKRDQRIKSLNKELIWENIYEQISPPKTSSIFLFKKVMKYAAAILIPVALAYGGWTLYSEISNDFSKNFSQIKPGEAKAQLIYSGQIIELGGQDTIFNSLDKNVEVAINSGKIKYKKDVSSVQKSEYHTLKIPKGGEYFLTLSDGTKVWLNSDTEIKFPSIFVENERRVYLKGEAFFEVAKDSKHLFIVHAEGLNVGVLGTKFNVSAYPDDDFINTTLVEGKVFVSEQISGIQQSAILESSQQAFLSKNGTQELIVQTVDTDLYTSWTEGKFIFRNESLDVILKKLSRWYNIEVFYDDAQAKYSKFSGMLPRFKNCETFLKLLEKTKSVEFEYTENSVLVKGVK